MMWLQVLHTEMFFDPQVHTLRGVEFTTFMPGFVKAIKASCMHHLPYSRALLWLKQSKHYIAIQQRWHRMASAPADCNRIATKQQSLRHVSIASCETCRRRRRSWA